jgi:hypothetical protein
VPWKERPPFGDLRLAPLLDAQATIAAAAGALDTVRGAAAALASIAATYASPALHACAALAAAREALLAGKLDEAIDRSAAAVAAWTDIGAPYESATARMVLGDAHQQAGNAVRALMEWSTAGAAFEAFGARLDAERAALRVATAQPRPVAARHREAATATFRCRGETRTFRFVDQTVAMRDLKGFRYVERLLGEPGREFHVLDLVAVERGSLPTGRRSHLHGEALDGGVDAGLPVIDEEARAAYRRRLREVDEDIEEATILQDTGRLELAHRDREYLIAELARAVGLGGRERSLGGTAERARTSVTRSVRYALGRLGENHPALAAHLNQTVRTGTYCLYSPDPLTPVVWLTGPVAADAAG